MGIDIDGGMIVGANGSELKVPEDYDGGIYDWLDDNQMETMSEHYDADISSRYVGFMVDDVEVSNISGEWIANVLILSEKFEKITGLKAKLIGTQNVW